MKSVFRALVIAAAVSSLSACIIHIGDDDATTSWQRIERRNLERIEALPMGINIKDARETVGEPQFVEAFSGKGGDYKVLFYRTHRVKGDDQTTRDETTPLVFKDGLLIGYGQRIYQDVLVK